MYQLKPRIILLRFLHSVHYTLLQYVHTEKLKKKNVFCAFNNLWYTFSKTFFLMRRFCVISNILAIYLNCTIDYLWILNLMFSQMSIFAMSRTFDTHKITVLQALFFVCFSDFALHFTNSNLVRVPLKFEPNLLNHFQDSRSNDWSILVILHSFFFVSNKYLMMPASFLCWISHLTKINFRTVLTLNNFYTDAKNERNGKDLHTVPFEFIWRIRII